MKENTEDMPQEVEKAYLGLNERQRRFCEEMIVDEIEYRAYKRAGYRPKSDSAASVNSSKLLRNAKVKIYLQWLRQQRAKMLLETNEAAIKEIVAHTRLMHEFDLRILCDEDGAILPLKDWPKEAATVVQGFTEEITQLAGTKDTEQLEKVIKRVRIPDRTKNGELLLRYYGAFDKPEEQPPREPTREEMIKKLEEWE